MNRLLLYLIKFIVCFCVLYFGTRALIGITSPGGYYSAFADNYLDYPALLRSSLLHSTRLLVGVFGLDAFIRDSYHLSVIGGRGIHLVYSCLGYGLHSFWIAFVFSNNGNSTKKIKWIIAGTFFIWLINVFRISLVLAATNGQINLPVNTSNHTFYNLLVYLLIFGMIWLYYKIDQAGKAKQLY